MNNEKKLREALEGLLNASIMHDKQRLYGAEKTARHILKETAPEPPKHPAQAGWENRKVLAHWEGEDCLKVQRVSYMQGFKDALEWAADKAENAQFDIFLRDTANTVPL